MRNGVAQSNASSQSLSSPSSSSSSSSSSTSTSLYSMDPVAQPHLGRVGAGSTRRDSMDPKAREPVQLFVAALSASVLDSKGTQDLEDGEKEGEMKSEKMWKSAKRAWNGFGRK